jgi:hypothetical protein
MRRNERSSAPAIEVEVMLDLPRRTKAGPAKAEPTVRIPRVTRLMALAVRYQGLVDSGELRDYADIARLGYVSRARITQIMNLSNLAPDIQAEILSPVGILSAERRLRAVAAKVEWGEQRALWHKLRAEATPCVSTKSA